MPEMNVFPFIERLKNLMRREDESVHSYSRRINYGEYSDILSSLPDNCIIQKPVTNEDLLKIINEVMDCGLK